MPKGVYMRSPERRAELALWLEQNCRHGSANPRWAGDNVSWSAAHARIRRVLGRACDRPCVDCGKQAHHWSFVEPIGHSTDPADYSPRCRTCHKRYDRRLLVEGYLRDRERQQRA